MGKNGVVDKNEARGSEQPARVLVVEDDLTLLETLEYNLSREGYRVVTAADGSIARAWGDPTGLVFPRSANKPLQALAMVELGLDLPGPQLALACASHSGEQFHLDTALEILHTAGLRESDPQLTITRLASDMSVGADLEYAAQVTCSEAMTGRRAVRRRRRRPSASPRISCGCMLRGAASWR